MTKEEFIKGLKFLGIAYNKEFNEEQATVWYEFFKNEDYEVFRTAVKRVIPKKQFIPSIAELKSEIALITNPILQLNADDEWDKALSTIRRYGRYRKDEAMAALSDHNRAIIKQIGFERICNSENIEWERRLYKELFDDKQDAYEDTLVLAEPQMTLAEITRMAALKSDERLMIEE